MSQKRLERLLWILAGLLVLVVARLSVVRSEGVANAPPPSLAGAPRVLLFDEDSLAVVMSAVAQTDPFRLDRKPSSISFGTPQSVVATTPPAPKFQLTVQGTMGGPPWYAVIAGIPGRAGGIMAREGDTLGGIRIKHIRRDTVTVQHKDSTWRITARAGGAG
jgi:hypothetical protein